MKLPDAVYFRRNAERCRMLVSIAINPTVREQLRLWARELDAIADELEGRSAAPEHEPVSAGREREPRG
jgi:hypothetical protein